MRRPKSIMENGINKYVKSAFSRYDLSYLQRSLDNFGIYVVQAFLHYVVFLGNNICVKRDMLLRMMVIRINKLI
jgi:hypothetical protein